MPKTAAAYDYTSKHAWKRPFKNAKKLLWGEGGKTFFGMGAMALTARTLGVADFGALAVLMSSVAIINQFITFEAWQLVLRYGAEALKDANSKAYVHVVGFALGLELLGACVGAVLLFFLSDFIIQLFNIPTEVAPILPWAGGLLILGALTGISDGTLRLTDRFHIISAMNVLPKATKFFIVLYLFMTDAGLQGFMYGWFLNAILSNFLRLSVGVHFLKKDIKKLNRNAQEMVITPWERGRFFSPKQEVWRFAFGLYTNSTLGIGTQQLGGPVLSAVLGTEAAGLYRIAERISMAVAAPVNKLLLPATFTDMAWLNAKKDTRQLTHMALRLGAVTGSAAALAFIILVFLGKPLIILIAGEAFVPAYGAMLVLVLNIVLHSTTFTIMPLVMTSGWVHLVVIGRTVMVALYLSLMYPLIDFYGVVGAAWATFISSLIATIIPVYGAFKYLNRG